MAGHYEVGNSNHCVCCMVWYNSTYTKSQTIRTNEWGLGGDMIIRYVVSWVLSVVRMLRLRAIRSHLYINKGKYNEIKHIKRRCHGTLLIVYYTVHDTLDWENHQMTYICFNIFTGRHKKISGRLPKALIAEACSNWGKEVKSGYSQSSLILDAPWHSHKYITLSVKFPEYVKIEESKEPVEGVKYTRTTCVFGYH